MLIIGSRLLETFIFSDFYFKNTKISIFILILNIEDINNAAHLELDYINDWSLNSDSNILMKISRILVFRKGAYSRKKE